MPSPQNQSLRMLSAAVRRRERGPFAFFASLFALITMAQTLGLIGSEALFLSALGAERLPVAMILASVVSVAGMGIYSAVVGRARNDRLFSLLLGLAALGLIAAAALLESGGTVLLFALFSGFFLTQAVFTTHFRTFATDFFDTLAAKRIFPLIAVGSSIGGVLGGVLGLGLLRAAPAASLIAGWGIGLGAAALLVRVARRSLRRWGPLALEEADESSAEGLRAAIRFVRRDALGRWLLIAVVGMVFSLSIMQFVYLDIFARTYPSAEALAHFFALYLALSNSLEIAIEVLVTPWLIRRFGVAQANLLHPFLTFALFLGLAVDPRLHVAIIARANREMLESALAGELRSLAYNALPFRFRGSMRALLEGVVFYAAVSVAGAALLLLGTRIPTPMLCALGAAAAALYLGASLRVRREYLRSLVDELRRGRLDLEAVGPELGLADVSSLGEQWEELVRAERERVSPPLLELIPRLAEAGESVRLQRGLSHADPRMRLACVAALDEFLEDDAQRRVVVLRALADSDSEVRLAACTAALRLAERPERALEQALDDVSPSVRGEAARALGEAGHAALRAMLRGPGSQGAAAALERLPDELIGEAARRCADPDPAVRAAALDRVARAKVADPPLATLLASLDHDDARVRSAAARALAARADPQAAPALAGALDDLAREVRSAAADALAALGTAGLAAAGPSLDHTRPWTVDAALSTVARAPRNQARTLLDQALRRRVREAWESRLALEAVGLGDQIEPRFLRAALENALDRCLWLSFRILELRENPSVVRSVRRVLDQSASPRARADALEVLTHLGEREACAQLALLLEAGPLEDKLASLSPRIATPRGEQEVRSVAANSPDRWLRLAVPSGAADTAVAAHSERLTMEALLALRQVPLFSHLSLDQLEAIRRFMRESQYLDGEIVVREGEPGDVLYLLLEGEARAYKDYQGTSETLLSTLPAVTYFGEISILDNAPRSATVVVSRDARLLELEGARFRELVLQAPEISFEVFRVLTSRLRAAEER